MEEKVMKYILRNNLWMMIVAWCLILRGYSLFALIVNVLASVYLLSNLTHINLLRTGIISLLFMIYCYLIGSVTVNGYYDHFVLFLSLTMLNVGITNERLQKERLNNIVNVFAFSLSAFVVFFILTLFLPKYLITEIGRLNMLCLIMIIFMPYSSIMLVSIIKKEYRKKQLLDKLERQHRAKMFDIKA